MTTSATSDPNASVGKVSRGDINADGAVSVEDAQLALIAYVNRMAGSDTGLTTEQTQAADVNEDKEISVDDAQNILIYYVNNTLSNTPTTWDELLGKKQPEKLPKSLKRK